MNQYLVQNNSVTRQQGTKHVVRTAAIFGFKLFLPDVTQAYLRASKKLMRKIHIDFPKKN